MPLESINAHFIEFIQGEVVHWSENVSTKQLAAEACNGRLRQEGEEELKFFLR